MNLEIEYDGKKPFLCATPSHELGEFTANTNRGRIASRHLRLTGVSIETIKEIEDGVLEPENLLHSENAESSEEIPFLHKPMIHTEVPYTGNELWLVASSVRETAPVNYKD